MTKWILECESCGEKRVLNVGFDLSEFKRLYIYCRRCGLTRPHRICGVATEEEASSSLSNDR